jgi:uncharacterized protein (UPF0303 family)
MADEVTERLADLAAQEARLVLDSFDNADAWELGMLMVTRAVHDGLPVIIDIRKPGLVLFHSALAGTTIENEVWLKRKARTTFRFEVSTALLNARFASQGIDQWSVGCFDSQRFTATGGAFPIRVHGAGLVAVATISGLASAEADHDFVMDSLAAYLRQKGRPS